MTEDYSKIDVLAAYRPIAPGATTVKRMLGKQLLNLPPLEITCEAEITEEDRQFFRISQLRVALITAYSAASSQVRADYKEILQGQAESNLANFLSKFDR